MRNVYDGTLLPLHELPTEAGPGSLWGQGHANEPVLRGELQSKVLLAAAEKRVAQQTNMPGALPGGAVFCSADYKSDSKEQIS